MNTIFTDDSKTKRQIKGVDIWWSIGKGCLVYPPRFGKTGVAAMIMDRLAKRKADYSIAILVASVIIKDQWIAFLTSEYPNIKYTIFTPVEANNLYLAEKLPCFDLLIVDELHKFISSERYAILCNIKRKSILGLTGTYPVGKGYEMLSEICPIIDTISEKEAIDNNWVSKFIEYNIAIELPYEDKKKYSLFTKPIKETLQLFKDSHKLFGDVFGFPLFNNDYDVVQSCYSGKKVKSGFITPDKIRELLAKRKGWSINMNLTNEYNQQLNEYWNPDNIKLRTVNFNDFVRKRNNIHISHPLKLQMVLDIFKKFPIPTICFNESTDMADTIAEQINNVSTVELNRVVAASYHSNIKSQALTDNKGRLILYKTGIRAGQVKMFGKDVLRRSIIQNMKDKSLIFLSTARALDEGLDIPNIEMVITTAGTTNPIQYTQRNARGKTVDIYNPDKCTKIINLYFDDFVDEDGNVQKSRDKTKLFYRQGECHSIVKNIKDISDIE